MTQKVKKIISILTFTFICTCLFSYKSACVYASTSSNVLGTASDFSIFVLNDHVHKNSDVTGRVAVGNNATYENYSIGNSLEKSTTRSDLIVGNELSVTGGNNFNGNTSIDSKGKVVKYTMTNNNNVANQPRKETIIDFNKEKNYLCTKTKELSSLAANGIVSNCNGQLNLKGSDKDLVVFNINNENLKGINGINIDVPESATVIMNILSKDVEIGNLSIFYKMNTPSDKVFRKWLWNFPQTEKLSFYSISVKGSILAPYATFDAKGCGNIEGTVILNNFYNQNAGFEVHNDSFTGSVPSGNSDTITTTPGKSGSGQEEISVGAPSDNGNKTEEVATGTPSNSGTKTEGTASETGNASGKTENASANASEEGTADVKAATESKNESTQGVKTGDSNNLIMIFSLLVTSGIALVSLRKFKRI